MSQRGLGRERQGCKAQKWGEAHDVPSRRPGIADAGGVGEENLAQRGNPADVGCTPVSISPCLPTCCGEEACPALAQEHEDLGAPFKLQEEAGGRKGGGEESLFYLSIILQVLIGVPLCLAKYSVPSSCCQTDVQSRVALFLPSFLSTIPIS